MGQLDMTPAITYHSHMLDILIISVAEQKEIDDLIEFAKRNPISADDIQHAMQARGDDLLRWKSRLNAYTMRLPLSYLVTYTQEQQPPGLCHHINVSMDDGIPNPTAMTIICTAFGMGHIVSERKALKTWPETYATGRVSLHILARVDQLAIKVT
jgi:hypothetical protein